MSNARQELKARACAEIERRADALVTLAEELWRCPEIGFQEGREPQGGCRGLEQLGLRTARAWR